MQNELSFYLKPIFRIGNSFYSKLRSDFTFNKAQRGFAQIYENEPLFGKRELNIFENTAEATYMVNSKLGLTFRARHYWANGEYQEYYKLLNNGQLGDIVEVNNLNNDFTYSVFNIDFGLQWEFAPEVCSISLIKMNFTGDKQCRYGIFQIPTICF